MKKIDFEAHCYSPGFNELLNRRADFPRYTPATTSTRPRAL